MALNFDRTPIKRMRSEKLPCQLAHDTGESCCPKGSPDAGIALWPHNIAAYQHYQRCKAVGRFPNDSLVESHAAVIAEVESQWDRMQSQRLESLLMRPSH